MQQREYADFDLAIEDVGGGRFRARVLDSPSGQASIEFELPFSEMELENFLLKIGRPRSGVRRLESPETEAARAFGGRLYEAVFASDVGTQWVRSVDSAERDQRGLRLRLRLDEAPQLADLPWEYLYSPTSDDFVVLSSWTPMVRYISLDKGAPPLRVAPPLRMLAMVSSPSDYPPLDVEEEWARLDEGLAGLVDAGLVEIHRLENATLRELQRATRRTEYHLFHFIGHGGYDAVADDGLLLLETDQGRAREVSGRQLGTILDDARTIRVAVLNACEGARASGTDPFAGVAQSLVARGIPAVVAMQFEITDRAAIVFAHEFYTAITDGLAIEGAVGEARRAIFGSKNDVEWGTAVLYMRAEDGRLFDLTEPPVPTIEVEATTIVLEPDDVPTLAAEPIVHSESPVLPLDVEKPEAPVAELPVVRERAVPTDDPNPIGDQGRSEAGEPAGDTATARIESMTPRPPQPGWVQSHVNLFSGIIVGLVAAVVVAFIVVNSGGDDGPGNIEPRQVRSTEIVGVAVGDVVVDGSLAEWSDAPVSYVLDSPVSNDLGVDRQGSDSVGRLWVAYDSVALYVAVEVSDDDYSQLNTGNQIWRGDALDINFFTGSGAIPDRPDSSTFQLTMTPVSEVTGAAEAVLFVGNGQGFGANTTQIPVRLAGDVTTDGWILEAMVPWSVFDLGGPPETLDSALFGVFDNDGEMDGDRPAQAAILTNVPNAFFQEPQTWGSFVTE